MSIQGKTYANKHGKAEGRQNKVQITMDIEDAEGIAGGDKSLRADLSKVIKSVAKGSKK